MKKFIALAMTVAVILTTAGCAGAPDASGTSAAVIGTYQIIDPENVKKMMDNGDDFILVDVRTPEEFEETHIPSAINIPVETIGNEKPAALPELNATIVVYCRVGNRSAVAAKALIALGYTSVYDMGGINTWPYDTVSGPEPSPSSEAGILSSFTATDLYGNEVDASIFKDYQLTMINIWATFCSPCLAEMPELGEMSIDYKDKGVQIVGIVADAADTNGAIIQDMVDTAKYIVEQTGAEYLHILPSEDLNRLILHSVAGVPTTIFVDSDGKQVGQAILGAQSGEKWATIIDELLKEVE